MDWREDYKRKLTTAEEAAKLVKSGDTLAVGASTDQPKVLPQAIVARKDQLRGVKVFALCPISDPGWLSPGLEESFEVTLTGFVGPIARPSVTEKRVDFIPNSWAMTLKAYDRPGEEKNFDVLVITVSPPNKHGYCCLGPMLWAKKTWMGRAKKVIAEVDANIKWAYGNTTVHVSEIDCFVEHTPHQMTEEEVATAVKDLPQEKREKIKLYMSLLLPHIRALLLPVFAASDVPVIDSFAETIGLVVPKTSEEQIKAISGYFSTMIKSGDCFQIGQGSPSAFLHRLGGFEGKEDLGYHAEMTARGVATMIKEGQITGKYKQFMKGKSIFSGADGMSPEELEFASENPSIEFYETAWVTRPDVICQNENHVSIQNGIAVDLMGQINSETIFGGMPLNGPGGQPESHLGALLSKGGRSITMLRSTALGGSVSCIVPQLEQGSVVTVPRHHADYVVTEYGIAKLMGKSFRERAEALIAIAHPEFRAELRKEARRLFYP